MSAPDQSEQTHAAGESQVVEALRASLKEREQLRQENQRLHARAERADRDRRHELPLPRRGRRRPGSCGSC